MAKNDAKRPTYYIDSGVFIDLISHPPEDEPAKSIANLIQSAEEGKCRLITSTVTIIEVLKASHEKTGNVFDNDTQARIDKLWHPGSSPIQIVEAHEMVMREAAKTFRDTFRDHGWSKAKGIDVVHMVVARREKVDEFFTTELQLNKYASIFGFTICAPHLPPKLVESDPVESKPEADSKHATLFDKADKEDADEPAEPTEEAQETGTESGDTPSGGSEVGGSDGPRNEETEAKAGVAKNEKEG